MKRLPATPSQTAGPFFRLGLDRPEWSKLVPSDARGEAIAVEGRVLDGDGAPVDDALLEIWQADGDGRYGRPEGAGPGGADRGGADRGGADRGGAACSFRGFGRALTDTAGRYRFETVRPGRVAGPGGALQAPHLDVAIFARGLLRHLVTRIYFEGDPANEADAVLCSIGDPAARRTLIAVREGPAGAGLATFRFDVVLQGPGETAFFEL